MKEVISLKRLSAALLALVALVASLPCLAEAEAPRALAEGEALSVDLDGDGAEEALRWEMVPGEYDEMLTLHVAGADGAEIDYPTDILWGGAVYVADLNGDGAQEILLTGDLMSDDYCTWCLHYAGGALHEVLFPDCSRGDSGDGYYKVGFGGIYAIDGNRLTLAGSQDVLGTWSGARTLALTPWERFEFDDDGLWQRTVEGGDTASLWEYGALTLKVSLPWRSAPGGDQAGTLSPGDRIVVYASDKLEWVWFATPEGDTGVLAISPDYDRGWGLRGEGIPEEDCFGQLFYAD